MSLYASALAICLAHLSTKNNFSNLLLSLRPAPDQRGVVVGATGSGRQAKVRDVRKNFVSTEQVFREPDSEEVRRKVPGARVAGTCVHQDDGGLSAEEA